MQCTYRFWLAVVPAALCILCAGARGDLVSHWTFDGTGSAPGYGITHSQWQVRCPTASHCVHPLQPHGYVQPKIVLQEK